MYYEYLTLIDGSTLSGPFQVVTTSQGTAAFKNQRTRFFVPMTSVLYATAYDMEGE